MSTTSRTRRSDGSSGFTLLEMMVVIAIIGGMMALVFTNQAENRLVSSRLGASAARLAGSLELLRTQALLSQQEIVVELDFENRGFSAHFPVELDVDGKVLGPGKTLAEEFVPLRERIAFEKVILADGQVREEQDEIVSLSIGAGGQLPDVDIMLHNVDFPDTEVHTLQLYGIQDRVLHVEGRTPREYLDDADFR
ncbi:MAG: hypothetical protein DHS20C15_02580 [Planctomycetota bacterium]|nr:MAG: hypothetical protein DHS20C15_02580 [Planctomycetota bacterium]